MLPPKLHGYLRSPTRKSSVSPCTAVVPSKNHGMSTATRREFMQHRLVQPHGMSGKFTCYLETPKTIQACMSEGLLPLAPSSDTQIVCCTFWRWTLHCSETKCTNPLWATRHSRSRCAHPRALALVCLCGSTSCGGFVTWPRYICTIPNEMLFSRSQAGNLYDLSVAENQNFRRFIPSRSVSPRQ